MKEAGKLEIKGLQKYFGFKPDLTFLLRQNLDGSTTCGS